MKPKVQTAARSEAGYDSCQTPPYALTPLLPFLPIGRQVNPICECGLRMIGPGYANGAPGLSFECACGRSKSLSDVQMPKDTHKPTKRPGSAKKCLPVETEQGVQQRIAAALTALGYEVMVTSRQRRKCRQCGAYSSGGDGVTKGLGDLLVWRSSWPWWVKVEADVKTENGSLSSEQVQRVRIGALRIWRGHEEAIHDCERVELLVNRR